MYKLSEREEKIKEFIQKEYVEKKRGANFPHNFYKAILGGDEDYVIPADYLETIAYLLNNLSDKHIEVIVYYYAGRKTHAEIAIYYGCATSYIGSIIKESLKICRREIRLLGSLDLLEKGISSINPDRLKIVLPYSKETSRALNSLRRAGYSNINDLNGMTTDDLLKIRGLGKATLKIVLALASDKGITIIQSDEK